MTTSYTAREVRDMVAHIEGCDVCGDEEIRASLYDESCPPEELADTIEGSHSQEWRAFLGRRAAS